MKRGTEVGRGYVQLEINGDGMNDDIVDSIDSAGPGVVKAGKEHGEGYGDGFEEGFFDRITDTLTEKLESELNRNFKNMGQRLGRSLSKNLGSAVGEKIDEIEVSMGRMLDNMENRIGSVSGNGGGGGGGNRPPAGGLGDGTPDDPNRAFYAAFQKARVSLHESANRMIEKADKAKFDQEKALLKQQSALYDAAAKAHRRDVDSFSKLWNAAHAENIKRTQRSADRFTRIWAAAHAEDIKRSRAADKARNGGRGSDRSMGSRVGDLLGGGSRNNALNLFGKSIGGIVSMVEKMG
ncbi:hypothetical protein, partial [Aeromicrobium sp.]|uniref:hypothetical protein n=1 Tax=Aeromicrobium sp. TaxID=1871063 RepID=UPI00199A1CD3